MPKRTKRPPRPPRPPRKLTVHPLTLWRIQRGLTQDAFVKLVRDTHPDIGFTQGYLSMIEHGEKVPSMKLAAALSRIISREASAQFIRDTSAKIGRQRRARARRGL